MHETKKSSAVGSKAFVALLGMCLLGSGAAAQAAKWQNGWPLLSLMKPREMEGAGFSVEVAQRLLRARGFAVKVDGNFGMQSREATRRFQRSHGLKATGMIDDVTWRKLILPLRKGSRGDAVRAVQIVLHEFNESLAVDGVFGPATQRAVIAFQKSARINADGIVGPMTWRELVRDLYD